MSGGDEVAVVGLARSGRAAAAALAARGARVYASDLGQSAALTEAARELTSAGVAVELGRHDMTRIRRAKRLVVSPGVPSDAPAVAAAREASVPVVSEIAVGLEMLRDSAVIAVTGTNGKSTTTALIAHLLRALGCSAEAAGNIGAPLTELALRARSPEWIALEISSFQLHDTPGFSPRVGVLTNLSPDHLDRYRSVEDYYADKRLLFAAAHTGSHWVTNADDAAVVAMVKGVPGEGRTFSLRRPADARYDAPSGTLSLLGRELSKRDELQVFGEHNVANALAAALAVAAADERFRLGSALGPMRDGLRSFVGLPHRLERVAVKDDVEWINDSKATNVAAASVAVRAMARPTVLLLGGRDKGESYAPLLEAAVIPLKRIIAFGEAAPLIERDLGSSGVPFEKADADLGDVVRRAAAAAKPGDCVLLAPACSSFDMFRDYEERGERFRALVTAL